MSNSVITKSRSAALTCALLVIVACAEGRTAQFGYSGEHTPLFREAALVENWIGQGLIENRLGELGRVTPDQGIECDTPNLVVFILN